MSFHLLNLYLDGVEGIAQQLSLFRNYISHLYGDEVGERDKIRVRRRAESWEQAEQIGLQILLSNTDTNPGPVVERCSDS